MSNLSLMVLGDPGSNWLGRMLHGRGAIEADRDVQPEYLAPSYSVSLKSVLIVVAVLVVLFVAALLLFT